MDKVKCDNLEELYIPTVIIKENGVTIKFKDGNKIESLKLREIVFVELAGVPMIGYYRNSSLLLSPMSDISTIDLSARYDPTYVKDQSKTDGVF